MGDKKSKEQQSARKWFRMKVILKYLANVSLVLQIIMPFRLVIIGITE
jgi:hypothetical protein